MDFTESDANAAPLAKGLTSQDLAAHLYSDLRVIARKVIRERRCPGLLQTTAIMHEAWIRLRRYEHLEQAEARDEFLRVAAAAIRSVLVDEARREGSDKRGGGWRRISLGADTTIPDRGERWIDLLDLDVALGSLAEIDQRRSRVVEMRFFGGLTMPEIARALDVSLRTAEGEWQLARAWLRARLSLQSQGDGM